MHQASFLSDMLSGAEGRQGFAREICALRDWLVPREDAPPPAGYPSWGKWQERQRLRALLTAEAERAERGDG